MKKRITAWLLSAAMLLGMMPLAQARGTVENTHTEQTGAYVEKIKVDIDEAGNQPWVVNMTVTPSSSATSGTQYYAVLLRTDMYQKAPVAGDVTQINMLNFDSLAYVNGGEKYYRSETTATISGPGDTVSIIFPALQSFFIGANGTEGTTANDSFQEYTYVVFSSQGGTGKLERYAVGTFVVGADGFLKSPSYILHYNTNGAANGSSQATSAKPASKIVKLDANGSNYEGSVTLAAQKPTRNGYTFHGWDAKQTHWQSFLKDPAPTGMGEDRYMDAAACSSRYTAGSTVTYADLLAAHNAANSTNVQPNEANLYGAYTLYAQWRPIQVGIDKDAQEAALTAKVGVPFTYTPVITGAVNANAEGKKTVKRVTIVASSYDEAAPGDTLVDGKTALPPGLSLNATTGVISGTPQKSWDHVIRLRLHIEDQSNKTTDEVEVVLPKIEKADQYLPELDKNVGLETRVADTDGQIFGFYAPGNTSSTSDGTGSSAATYLDLKDGKEANIFEYLPLTDPENKSYGLTEWRELPLPESYYADLPETAEDADTVTKADLAASMEAGATLNFSTRMTQADGVQTQKSARAAGWAEPYGSIVYEELAKKDGTKDKFPVLHGLPEGAVYAVRFKANNGYTASPQLELTITAGGGAVSGDSAGPTLSIHLLGGTVENVEAKEGDETAVDQVAMLQVLRAACASAISGSTVEIPTAIMPQKTGFRFNGWLLGTLDPETGEVTYTSLNAEEGMEKIPVTLKDKTLTIIAEWIPTADPSAYTPVVLYDWDGTTVLSSFSVSNTAPETEIRETIDAATKELMSPQNEGAYDDETYAKMDDSGYCTAYPNTADPLSDKQGYTFGKWISFDAKDTEGNPIYTNYGAAVSPTSTTALVIMEEPQEFAITDETLKNGILLKAAYCANTDMKSYVTATDRYYTVRPTAYLQYAATANIGITVEVSRNGVHRLRDPALRVSFVSDNTILSLTPLDNRDEVETTIAVNAALSSVKIEVIDRCEIASYSGTTNWATGSVPRAAAMNKEAATADGMGFIVLGAVGFFNDASRTAIAMGDTGDQIRNNKSISGVAANDTNYNYAELNIKTVANSAGTGAAPRRRGALANIVEMYQSLKDDGMERDLTQKDLQEAITNGTVWKSGAWTNGYVSDYRQ